ncbi:MAG: class I SAM-dependent methyltransferase, partial [Nocardioidaceae bacterium]
MATSRSALVYADFLLPHLTTGTYLVDVGCGDGELSLDLAREVRQITGVDSDEDDIQAANRSAGLLGTENADFSVGDAYALDVPDSRADAVLAHSVLEALDRPAEALAEMKRVLKPGGVVAAASVEYDGLILAGPYQPLVRRFYHIREQLWQYDGADPYLGRELRRLLLEAGYVDVVASTKSISYG